MALINTCQTFIIYLDNVFFSSLNVTNHHTDKEIKKGTKCKNDDDDDDYYFNHNFILFPKVCLIGIPLIVNHS